MTEEWRKRYDNLTNDLAHEILLMTGKGLRSTLGRTPYPVVSCLAHEVKSIDRWTPIATGEKWGAYEDICGVVPPFTRAPIGCHIENIVRLSREDRARVLRSVGARVIVQLVIRSRAMSATEFTEIVAVIGDDDFLAFLSHDEREGVLGLRPYYGVTQEGIRQESEDRERAVREMSSRQLGILRSGAHAHDD